MIERGAAVVVVWGVRRSGIHSIVTWLMRLLEPEVWIFNDLSKSVDPGADPYESQNFSAAYRADLEEQSHCRIPTPADRDTPKSSIVCVYEDSALCSVDIGHYLGANSKVTHFVTCRDPFNMMASRMKRFQPCPRTGVIVRADGSLDPRILSPERALNRWVEHATAVRDDGNWPNPNTVGIAFNKFVTDRNFRRELADRVGRPFDDTGINEVYAAGGGSSFEGTSKHGHAQEMKINERWILARENIEYRSLFQGRTDILELSEAVFGPIPGTRELVGCH